jgi:hypothetical protein
MSQHGVLVHCVCVEEARRLNHEDAQSSGGGRNRPVRACTHKCVSLGGEGQGGSQGVLGGWFSAASLGGELSQAHLVNLPS